MCNSARLGPRRAAQPSRRRIQWTFSRVVRAHAR
jgi:hypothetical protein